MWQKLSLALVLVALVATCAVQQRNLNSLNRQVSALLTEPTADGAAAKFVTRQPAETVVRQAGTDQSVYDRLTSLEENVIELARMSEYLMERGQVPLAARMADEVALRLGDATASDQDRLRALRLLRRNNALNDQSLMSAVNWLNTATNANLREDILQQLEGMTNAILQAPLLQFALNDVDAEVREQAVDNLGRYVADPQVEAHLWNILRNDVDAEVREEAARALSRGPVPPARLASLQQWVLNPDAPLDERMIALQALRRANADIPETMLALAKQAHVSTDPVERARLFEAFDGFNDPSLKVPLVYGLQDPNPEIRERAADALSSYRSDPAVQQWLEYVAKNDADPRVRREALRAMAGGRR